MRFFFLLIFFLTSFCFSQKAYIFDHCSTYECYNGNSNFNENFRTIIFGNSKDISYSLELKMKNNEVEYIYFKVENENEKEIKYFKKINIVDIVDGMILISDSSQKYYINNKNCNDEYDVVNTIIENITKQDFIIFKNKKRKEIKLNIEVEYYKSEIFENQKVNFGHAFYFFNCNSISFLSKIIKSYKIIYKKKVVESSKLLEIKPFNFLLYIK